MVIIHECVVSESCPLCSDLKLVAAAIENEEE